MIFVCLFRTQKLLDKEIDILDTNIKLSKNPIDNQTGMDILEFIDFSCTNFLNNLSMAINTYNEMFIHQTSET